MKLCIFGSSHHHWPALIKTSKVVRNSDPRGGLAIGVMGHIPTGLEVHKLKQKDALLYNSNNGVIETECSGIQSEVKSVMFKEGSIVGCVYEPEQHTVKWYF